MPIIYFAYTRVSTTKQYLGGTSLSEQHRSIKRSADNHGIQVVQWFEEVESASKGRRVVFKELIRQLKQKKGRIGLLIHKIDRGARNLRKEVKKDSRDISIRESTKIECRYSLQTEQNTRV
ncbi:MAG: recombinase family protein [Candidatus Thiodiazotropha endolucinida]